MKKSDYVGVVVLVVMPVLLIFGLNVLFHTGINLGVLEYIAAWLLMFTIQTIISLGVYYGTVVGNVKLVNTFMNKVGANK